MAFRNIVAPPVERIMLAKPADDASPSIDVPMADEGRLYD